MDRPPGEVERGPPAGPGPPRGDMERPPGPMRGDDDRPMRGDRDRHGAGGPPVGRRAGLGPRRARAAAEGAACPRAPPLAAAAWGFLMVQAATVPSSVLPTLSTALDLALSRSEKGEADRSDTPTCHKANQSIVTAAEAPMEDAGGGLSAPCGLHQGRIGDRGNGGKSGYWGQAGGSADWGFARIVHSYLGVACEPCVLAVMFSTSCCVVPCVVFHC